MAPTLFFEKFLIPTRQSTLPRTKRCKDMQDGHGESRDRHRMGELCHLGGTVVILYFTCVVFTLVSPACQFVALFCPISIN